MKIAVHDNNMKIVDYIDNSVPGSLKFENANFEQYLDGTAATFDLTIPKFLNEQLHPRLEFLKPNAYLSFKYEGRSYVMSIRHFNESDTEITIMTECAPMELLNEYVDEFKQDEKNPKSYTLLEYFSILNVFKYSKVIIGVNELTTDKRILNITSGQNIYGTILNLVNEFGGECEFITDQYPDGRLKDIILNIYKAKTNENPNAGIGSVRKDVTLYIDRQVEGVSYTHDRTNQFTGVRIKDKDGNFFKAPKNRIVKASDEKHNEFYWMRNSNVMYAPLAMLEYPSMMHSNDCDNWTIKEFKSSFESTEFDKAYEYALQLLRDNAYGVKKYTIKLDGLKIQNKYNIHIGDIIYLKDWKFSNGLLLQMRVDKISVDFADPTSINIQVTNVIELASGLSEQLLDRYARMIEDAKPYTMSVLTSNGVTFKELDDTTTLYPKLYKGGSLLGEETGRYFTYRIGDEEIGTGDSFEIKAYDFQNRDKIVVTVVGWANGVAAMETELTIFTVKDGVDAYNVNVSSVGGTQFVNGYGSSDITVEMFQGASLIDLKDYKITWRRRHGDEVNPDNWIASTKTVTVRASDFVKTATYYATVSTKKGNTIGVSEMTFSNVRDGKAGEPGAVGKDGKQSFNHFAYSNSADGSKNFSLDDPTGREFLGTYSDFTQADSTNPNKYKWIRVKGDRGNDGLPGKDGVGVKKTIIEYGISPNNGTQPSSWSKQVPTLSKGNYLWTRTTWQYSDNSTEVGYQSTYIARDGNNGSDGIAGKDGVGIVDTIIKYMHLADDILKPEAKFYSTFKDRPLAGRAGNFLNDFKFKSNDGRVTISDIAVGDIVEGPDLKIYKVASTTVSGGSSDNPGQVNLGPTLGEWVDQVPDIPDGEYLWTRVEWKYSDNTHEFGYSVARMGRRGQAGRDGQNGRDGRDGIGIRTTDVTYALSDSDKRQPDNWTTQPPSLVKSKWLWTKTVWTYTDNHTEVSYQKTYIPENGSTGADGKPGKDGVGLRSTVVEYATSNDGVNAPINGWSRLIPQTTLNYTWTRTTWQYTDNSFETAYSVAKNGVDGKPGRDGINGKDGTQGLPGKNGADGRTQYTHIAYADDSNGNGLSFVGTNKTYIGMYQDFVQTNSNDKTKYNWTKWRGNDGAQGVPGPKGVDGKTPYIHFAYANSSDGVSDFALVNDGTKRYMGQYTDFIQADSRDPKKYSWIDMTGSVKIGGRNLFLNSRFEFPLTARYSSYNLYNVNNGNNDGLGDIDISINNSGQRYNGMNSLQLICRVSQQRNQKVTFTFGGDTRATQDMVRAASNKEYVVSFWGKASTTSMSCVFRTGYRPNLSSESDVKFTTEWKYYSFVFIGNKNDNATEELLLNPKGVGTIWLAMIKIEQGSQSTDFSVAPEDLEYKIGSKADAKLTDEQIKLLSEQNARNQAELSAKASLNEVDTIVASINAYRKSSDEARAAMERDLVTQAQRIVQLQTNLGDMAARTDFIDSYLIQSNEGLSIGKNDGSSSILFSPNGRIGMYSAGKEVMYIDKGMLYIDNGTFVKSLQIGRYRTQPGRSNPDINTIIYVG